MKYYPCICFPLFSYRSDAELTIIRIPWINIDRGKGWPPKFLFKERICPDELKAGYMKHSRTQDMPFLKQFQY